MSAGDAVDKYVILTIGDGLVSSIPSLMISLSTGILVTKAGKELLFDRKTGYQTNAKKEAFRNKIVFG